MTGAYDPQLDTVYWTVGNPGPDMIGDDRLATTSTPTPSSRSTPRPAR
jgi:glucose dehydrogenase